MSQNFVAPGKSLTISDVARLAGVSKKSVSRVLNDEQGVSDATRERVKAIMAEHGYRPDRRARALAGNRSFLVALAYNNPNAGYIMGLLQGVLRAANERGYEVIMHPLPFPAPGSAGDDLVRFVSRAGCDGLVLTPPLSESPTVLAALGAAGIDFVRISGDDTDFDAPQVRFDDRAAALLITSHLTDEGHRRIAFVGGPETSGTTRRRLAGFRDALLARGVKPDMTLERFGNFTFLSGMAAVDELLALENRPTAVMCCNDEMAAGAIHAARQRGLSVPDQLSVTGFDDSAIAGEVWPPLTTVRQPLHEMGEMSAELLMLKLDGQGMPPHPIRGFEHTVLTRQSSGPAPS